MYDILVNKDNSLLIEKKLATHGNPEQNSNIMLERYITLWYYFKENRAKVQIHFLLVILYQFLNELTSLMNYLCLICLA